MTRTLMIRTWCLAWLRAPHRAFTGIFVDHPRSVDETYFQHMRFAGWFASRLLLAGGAALVHALIPRLFEHTAGRMILAMHARLAQRG